LPIPAIFNVMKYSLLLLLLYAFSFKSVAQSTGETLKQSVQLVKNKKYESAYNLLEKADPKNDDADIVLAKEDILLGDFVTSFMHQMFGLKDLQPNEDIADYRGKAGNYSMHFFRGDSLLKRLITKQPDNYKLYHGLGNYYYEVFLHYDANWVENAETLFKYIDQNYQKVIDLNGANYMVFYELGYIDLVQKKYPEAVIHFSKSLGLDSTYANSSYNLAYAYLYQNDRTNALKYAIRSIDLYKDKSYKADAARMTGEIYEALKDLPNEIIYYELSDKIDADNYNTLLPLLRAYVISNNIKEDATLNRFYLLAPDKPTIYNDLEAIYPKNSSKLIGFYEKKQSEYKSDDKVYGSLCFYLGKLYLGADNAKAKENLIKAKTSLAKVFDTGNGVFAAIDQLMKKAG